jgi:GT2 family glycosyltransferase
VKPIDIGTASWQSPTKLDKMITHVKNHTVGPWRLFVIDNDSPDPKVKDVILKHATDERVIPIFLEENIGYVGAVNKLFELCETQFVAYVDNDAYVETNGWNNKMMEVMERHPEVAMVFSGSTGASYPIPRGDYIECLWGVGCFWVLNHTRVAEIGGFDPGLGHQEEVDFQMRLHLAGWKCASLNTVTVRHDSTSSNNPEARERINQGIIRWVDKWNKYFVGPHVNYFSPNVTRFEDWMAPYLEEWYKRQPELQNLNSDPETVYVAGLGREVDLIKVPRYQHLYRDRII